MRSPINWIGNRYKYLENIDNLVKDKHYNAVRDVFMGSGNILLNIGVNARFWVGNDIIPLIPHLYTSITTIPDDFIYEELEKIINNWNRFSSKEDYYTFRDYWNNKYLAEIYNKEFIYETILLLKMCSNSMVRFNAKIGYGGGFTEEDDRYLIDFMENTKNDFIYFNYLMRDGVVKQDLIDLLDRRDLFVEELSHSTSTGQGIKESLPITEVMISNIKGVG